jgi:uroporphyrinogen-III decarboxylase
VPAFAPPLGTLAASLARRPLDELWGDRDELVRLTLEAAARARASAVLFPFDTLVPAEAAGAELAWTPLGPVVADSGGCNVADLEAGDVLAAGRAPAALEAARLLASSATVAAHVPAPAALVGQLGGDPGDDDQLAAAEDVCAAFARGLLEAGATWLVVQPDSAGAVEVGPLRRLAGHFQAQVAVGGGDDPDVAVVPVSALTDPAQPPPSAAAARLVLTDAPVPAGADLAVWSRQAGRLLGEAW